MAKKYEVYCNNIGLVHSGNNKRDAMRIYREYVAQSKSGIGRAAGETVYVMGEAPFGSDVISEHIGTVDRVA